MLKYTVKLNGNLLTEGNWNAVINCVSGTWMHGQVLDMMIDGKTFMIDNPDRTIKLIVENKIQLIVTRN